MDYNKYLNKKIELYNSFLQFIDNGSDDDNDYQNLMDILEKQEIVENCEEMLLFLHLLVRISDNHHRIPNFYQKIEKNLQNLMQNIKRTFSNSEIFNIFKSNKILVLFLIQNNIIVIDENVVKEMFFISEKTNTNYHYFFYPEIKNFLNKQDLEKIEIELNIKEQINALTNFDHLREIGENETYICELIRNDSIEKFVSYVNRINFSLSSTIKSSIFETNKFLIKNDPSLIEYASFYGSIQIFQYLKFNNVEMNPSLWLYAIHGENAELIHLLEECSIEPPNETYITCFNEAVKCHHNDLANYFKSNYIDTKDIDFKIIYKNYNYIQMPYELEINNSIFYYMCRYNYHELVDLYLSPKESRIKNRINAILDAADNDNTELIYILLKEIGNLGISHLFQNNTNLKQIVLPSNITEIGESSFSCCSSLEKVFIPSSVTTIGEFAFDQCVSLTEINIPKSVTSIKSAAFYRCSKLTKITIPSSVKSIGDRSFFHCESLQQIHMNCFLTKIEDYTFACCGIENIKIPPTVKSIGSFAFLNCRLKKLSIPSSVKSIGDYTFKFCDRLKEIEIPTSVKSVGEYAFVNCYELEEYMENDPNVNASGGEAPLYLFLFFNLILFIINIIAVFITAVVWWSRIHPWFSHGYKTGEIVYKSLETSWISSLIAFISPLFYLLYAYLFKLLRRRFFTAKIRKFLTKCKKCFDLTSALILFILVLIAIISAMVASVYALKKEKMDGVSIKCLRYIFDGCEGAKNWVYNQSLKKQNEFSKWVSKMNSKAYKKNGDATNYYCYLVGVPIMIFSIFSFLSAALVFILFMLLFFNEPF